jgi:hypothetical protein
MNLYGSVEPTSCAFGSKASAMRVGLVLCRFEPRYDAYSLNTP